MNKIAIQGHPTRGKEIIQILKSLGATSYRVYDKCSNPKWYWLIDKNKEIVCYPKKSIWGYKLYTLEEFEKKFPFKIGDKVIHSYTPNFIGTVVDIKFDDHIPYRVDIKGKICTCGTMSLKPYKEMKEERNITLTLDKAKEWYKKGGELKEIALQAYSEEELTSLPRSWEDYSEKYCIKKGEAYINSEGKILTFTCNTTKRIWDNICPSQKSAEAHLAMIQLEQLRDCWRQGWEPIWDISQKYCIYLSSNEVQVRMCTNVARFLTFPTREMAEEFLECFRNLIEKAGDLI